ncbi:MAG: pilus assembly protein, partial [Chloroflexi bacterium]|nr:pilus assembly protein [Chloroflexota bacterium]
MSNRQEHNKGASLVEMALMLPILVLILAGVGDLGRAFHDYIVINNASREGARYASHFPDADVGIKQTTVNEAVSSGVAITTSQVAIGGLNSTKGNPITVTVSYPFRPILTRIIGRSVITMTARTQM